MTALCFSYSHTVLAVAHSQQLSMFNVTSKKCVKWQQTVTVTKDKGDSIKHIYFNEEDDLLAVVTEKYDTKFYTLNISRKNIMESAKLPPMDVVWWPRIPLTSYILKGLYQKGLVDADVCGSHKVAASADRFGALRLYSLPALTERPHSVYQHHHGEISNILFIPNQDRLISVGLHDRSIVRWRIERTQSASH